MLLYAAALSVGACGPDPGGAQSVRFTETPAAPLSTAEPSATPPPSSTPACAESAGRIEAFTYSGVVVDEAVPVRVYFPPCYEAGETRYPVAYLLHGKPYDESHWDELGVGSAADQGIASGEWPPFLLVLPLQPEPIFTNSDGGPWSYEEELIEGLVPFVDGTFRTDPRAEARALVGISRGGIWALEIGFRNPSIFATVGALSPALSVNHARLEFDPFQLARQAEELPAQVLLVAGDSDWARGATERLAATLTESGRSVTLEIVPGAHEDPTWRAALERVLSFLSSAWQSFNEAGIPPRSSIP